MTARIKICPQCGDPVIQPRDSEEYCENCGWPDENRDQDDRKCEACDGVGTIDESLGGEAFSNPASTCPDCDGRGYYETWKYDHGSDTRNHKCPCQIPNYKQPGCALLGIEGCATERNAQGQTRPEAQ